MTQSDLTIYHKFDPENYEKEIYEVVTSAGDKIPGYPNAGKMINLLDNSEIPLELIYAVRLSTEDISGVEPTYSPD